MSTTSTSSSRKPGNKPISDCEIANVAVHRAKCCAEKVYLSLHLRRGPFIGVRDEEGHDDVSFKWITYEEAFRQSMAIAFWLNHNIVVPKKGKASAIVSSQNSPEQMLSLLGAATQGLVLVNVSHTLTTDDLCGVLRESPNPAVVFCEMRSLPQFLDAVNMVVLTPRFVILPTKKSHEEDQPSSSEDRNMNSLTLQPLLEVIKQVDVVFRIAEYVWGLETFNDVVKLHDETTPAVPFISQNPADVCTIIFTSGSTGSMKGAEFTHALWGTRAMHCPRYAQGTTLLLHESMSWATGYRHFFYVVATGGKLAISNGMSQILEEAAVVKPTEFVTVPLVWKTLKQRYESEVFTLLHSSKAKSLKWSEEDVKRRVTAKYQTIFAACGTLLIGGAASSSDVTQWMIEVFGRKFRETYGTTEVGMIAETGNDGYLCIAPNVQFKLRDVPELNCYRHSKPHPRGELLVKTVNTITTYTDRTIASEKFDSDHYFSTGDVVELRTDRSIRIIDRIANVVKLDHGIFVTPGVLSEIYGEVPGVKQVYIHAAPSNAFLVSLVVPNYEFWSERMASIPSENRERVIQEGILQQFQRQAQVKKLKPHEIPRSVAVVPTPFTVENGQLTASQKPCRHAIASCYHSLLDALLSGQESGDQKPKGNLLNKEQPKDFVLACRIFASLGIGVPEDTIQFETFRESSLGELGMDSLLLIRLRSQLMTEFVKSAVPPQRYFSSVRKVKDILQTMTKGIQCTSSLVNWDQERTLDEEIRTLIKSGVQGGDAHDEKCILVLGGTGFLGRHVIDEVLYDEELVSLPKRCRVVCIVRANCDESAKQRLVGAFEESRIHLTALQWGTIDVVSTNETDARNFGLSDMVYQKLLTTCVAIINCASKVDYISDYLSCQKPNVNIVKECIRFCALSQRGCAFHQTSTTSVLQVMRNQPPLRVTRSKIPPFVVNEDNKDGGLFSLCGKRASNRTLNELSGYVSSKYVAEELCYQAIQYGLSNIHIHRIGMIGPSTLTGASQSENFVTRIIHTALQLRKVPNDVPAQVGLVLNPVNIVASRIVLFVHQQGPVVSHYSTFQALNISFSALWDYVLRRPTSQVPPEMIGVPYGEWRLLCVNSTTPLAITPLLDHLKTRSMNNIDTNVSDAWTTDVLGKPCNRSGRYSMSNRLLKSWQEYLERMIVYLESKM